MQEELQECVSDSAVVFPENFLPCMIIYKDVNLKVRFPLTVVQNGHCVNSKT